MRFLPAVICIGCAALAAGCELLVPAKEPLEPAPWVQPGGPQPATDVESLVLYFAYIRRLTATDLNREYDVARQAYNRGRHDYNRVRFAMLLSLPNTPFNDDGRSLDVLEPIMRNGDGRFYPLAQMLSSQIQEQKRLNASVQGLQQKLDALKSLERSIIERSR
ncbi:MAG TPA: hypothetical protein VKD25_06650 [Burkholderiales bacterium]|nr:hypothetical protein [Burkholderiales bacterium]